jgi:hypothetical protein
MRRRLTIATLLAALCLSAPSTPRPLQAFKVLTATAAPLDIVPSPVDLQRIQRFFGITASSTLSAPGR